MVRMDREVHNLANEAVAEICVSNSFFPRWAPAFVLAMPGS